MSDYLSTLAARSLNAVPVATPRMTSLFESAPPAAGSIASPPPLPEAGAAGDRVVHGEAPVPTQSDRFRAREARPRAIPVVAPPMPPSVRPVDDVIARRGAHAHETVANAGHRTAADTTPSATVKLEPAGAAAVAARRAESSPVTAPPSREAHRDAVVAPDDLRAIRASVLDDVVRRLTSDRPGALERRPAREVDRVRAPAGDVAPPPAAERPPDAPRPIVVKPSPAAAANATDAQAPIVRVTIGRVEVRAVMPPAAAPVPPATTASSTASLDEYLKQRSGPRR